MIRNLKVLLAAALALAAIGGASAAQAAEFHCSVSPCRYRAKQDGTGKTAHQVFIVENIAGTESVSFTCAEIKGEGSTATTTATEVILENISYPTFGCTVNGSAGVEVVMNSCKYIFTSTGTVTIAGCTAGKSIEVRIPSIGCTFFVPEQGPKEGISYHTIGTTPTREVTVSADVTTLIVTKTEACAPFIGGGNLLLGRYTTGNAIVTGETSAGVMADAWFA